MLRARELVVPAVVLLLLLALYQVVFAAARGLAPLRVYAEYSRALPPGHVLAEGDLKVAFGRHGGAELPVRIPAEAVGRVLGQSVSAGEAVLVSDLCPLGTPEISEQSRGCAGADDPASSEAGVSHGDQSKPQDVVKTIEGQLAALENWLSEQNDTILQQLRAIPAVPNDLSGLIQIHEMVGSKQGATVGDILVKALDVGGQVVERTGDSLSPFLQEFGKEFSGSLGTQLGEGSGQAVRQLGSFVFEMVKLRGIRDADQAPPARKPVEESRIVFFRAGADLDPDVDAELAGIAAEWKVTAGARACRISVLGHTDTVGSDFNNDALSQRRAEIIADRLHALMPAATIEEPESWGERRLAYKTGDGQEEPRNRRTEIKLHCGEPPA